MNRRAPPPSSSPTFLVVGVGGIGVPCAVALADAGAARLLLVDFDVVETSNLPRQVVFEPADVGRRKAEVAAERLAREGLVVEAVVARVDATNGPALFARADVVVDASDGASTKDLVNALAVAAGVPLVHAAALGHEGRVLDVPAGGGPCLACLFGRLSGEEGDTCESFGVLGTVTSAVGALAAVEALARAKAPRAPSRGLRVLDLLAGRATTLSAPRDPACPVCAPGADAHAGAATAPVGGAAACAAAGVARPDASVAPSADALDLRRERCPANLLRARRAMDAAPAGSAVEIWLGDEGAATVPQGLAALGHRIVVREDVAGALRLVVVRRAADRGANAGAAS